jgi:Carbohydrate binding domain (family 11)
MSKKLCSLIFCCVVLAAFAGRAWAIDDAWTNTTGDGLWKTPGNWSMNFVPDCSPAYLDKAKLNLMPGPVIDSTTAAKANWIACGDGGTGGMHMTGGTLTVGLALGDTWTILGYGASDSGTFTMDGGTITTADRVFVGFQGTGTLNMNGGIFNIGGTLGIGANDAAATTGIGTVNLAGGIINVAGAFQMSTPAGCIGKLDISGGTLNITGDQRTIVQSYINSGYIVAYSGLGNVNVSYDGVTTTVTGATNLYKARGPNPANSAANVPPYAILSWTPGMSVLTHDIYVGIDANSVRDADTSTAGIYRGSQNSDINSFTPTGLQLGGVYYWRIDEVNSTSVCKGDVWQFAVASFALIDDFEKYADTTAMSASWSNGSTGATLSLAVTGGHENPKTMKFDYSNAGAPFYSEAQTNDIDYDWTIAGVLAIDIWYKGSAGNAAVQMYAALEDNNSHPVAVVVNSDPNAAQVTDWNVWRIKLSDFTGINLANVKKFYIGFGSRTNPAAGGAGTVYFDDIELYPSRCLNPPATDLNGDCVVDFKDFVIMATNWLRQSSL